RSARHRRADAPKTGILRLYPGLLLFTGTACRRVSFSGCSFFDVFFREFHVPLPFFRFILLKTNFPSLET
ncbi:MAG: hypothetical protein LBL20_00485, partial [Treponema sp.]|nr:hypothetical protein [Treponema sp.]